MLDRRLILPCGLLVGICILLVLAGCVTPIKPRDTRDPEVITTHKNVTYPPIK